jgi:hypothetical protein
VTTAAARLAREYRRRQAAGKIVVGVEIDGDVIDLLCESGLLARGDWHDRVLAAVLGRRACGRRA